MVDAKSGAGCVVMVSARAGGTMAVPVPITEEGFEWSLADSVATTVPNADPNAGCVVSGLFVTVAGDVDVSDTIAPPIVVDGAISVACCVAAAGLSAFEAAGTVVVTVVSDTSEAPAVDDVVVCVKKLKLLVLPAPTPTAGTFPSSDPLLAEVVSDLGLASVALTAAAATMVVIMSEDSAAPGADVVAGAVSVKKLRSLIFPAPTPTAGALPSLEPPPVGAFDASAGELVCAALT